MTRVTLLLALIGCGGSSITAAPPEPPSTTAPPSAPDGPAASRLVVAIVLDQLPTHALERYLPHLPEDGALRRGIAAGAFHRQVVFEYAGTYTAAGHAAIHTGAPPAVSGVVSNEVFDRARQKEVPIVDDGEHAVHGVDGTFASPAVLRVPTVADALNEASAPTLTALLGVPPPPPLPSPPSPAPPSLPKNPNVSPIGDGP